jgi:hypothetical protein
VHIHRHHPFRIGRFSLRPGGDGGERQQPVHRCGSKGGVQRVGLPHIARHPVQPAGQGGEGARRCLRQRRGGEEHLLLAAGEQGFGHRQAEEPGTAGD